MKFVSKTIKGIDYKLRLTSFYATELQKKLGKPLLRVLESTETLDVEVMVLFLWATLQPLQSNISTRDCFDIYDEFLEDGNDLSDFIKLMFEVLSVCGYLKLPEGVLDGATEEKK